LGMRDNDGRKLDHKTLEQVRIRVVRQVDSGARPEYVASVLGFARSTVFGWMARYREGPPLVAWTKARTIPGRPQKLSVPQLRQIYTLIVGNDPRQLAFEFALWTREMVRELIRRESTSSRQL
jgi:transposase